MRLEKLHRQGYDGTVATSGIYSGVQARIVAKQLKLFMYTVPLNVNLVFNDAVSDVVDVKNFFGVVKQYH